MATVITSSSLPSDIEDELRAKNLSHFLLRSESNPNSIVVEVYENQAWHPVLQTWGSVVGVHLNAVLDRSPYTDESGTKVLSGSLAEVKPLSKYKWQGAWTAKAESGVTDASGFQYAASWSLLSNKYKPSTVSSPLVYVRRRRFTRKMIVDPDPPSKALPYEITLKVLNATVQGLNATSQSYIEIFLDRNFLDRTATGAPNWNHKLSKKIMEIDPEMTITFVLYSKKVLTLVNPFSSAPAPVEMIHRGTAHIVVRDFLDNLAVINREGAIDIISPAEQKIGSLTIRVDVLETRLFGVVPAFDDSLEELKKRTTDALPYDLRYQISTLDNDEHAFLKVLVSNVIEGRDVLTETDLIDVVSEAGYLQGVGGDSTELGHDGKPKPHQQLLRYPSSKPRYGKFIMLPSNLDEHKSDANTRTLLQHALRHEEALQKKNEYYDQTLPSVSSVFEPQTLAVNGYDAAYQPHQGDAMKSDFYDLVVYCVPEVEGEPEPSHVLRWTSYYDYVMMVAEMVKVQHSQHLADTVPVVVRHTCKVLYGCQDTPESKPTSWLPVSFTVDSEAEFLVIRESRVAREDQAESFDLIIPFDLVEGIVVRNTYHLSSHYMLDVRVHSASSHHLRHTLGKIHVETTDGHQRFNFVSDAFRKGTVAENQPATVIFQDTQTFLLPPSVLHGGPSNKQRECLHVTFSSEENESTDTPPVQGRVDLPLSHILPTLTSNNNVADCQVTFKNLQQHFELRLRVNSIADLFWRDPTKDLFNPLELDLDPAKLFQDADPYFVVYFADEDGQIIPLNGTTVGAASVVRDLAGNLVYLGTAGMVGNNKGESAQSVVGNVAKDLLYLGTAGMVGGKNEEKKKNPLDQDSNHSGHGANKIDKIGDVASNLLHIGTLGMVGKKKDEEFSQHGGPQRSASTMMKQGLGNFGGMMTGGGRGNQGNNNLPVPPNGKARPNTLVENKRQSVSGAKLMTGATNSLLNVGKDGIKATSNVIVGTSNVAVNVLTLGNTSIVSTMNKADAVYQSQVVHKTLNPSWDEEVVLSTERYGDVMRAAKFLLIEVWDKNTALADVCLGEVFVPIVCALHLDPETPDGNVPKHVGQRKYPLQLSKHMKINRALAKRMPAGLGSMRAQLLYREAPEFPDSTLKERGEHDPIKVNFIVQLKPVGALDFAWPSRVISSEQTADSMEQDVLYVRMKHDGLHLSVTLTQPHSDRVKMLMECREKSADSIDKNSLNLVIPYNQVSLGESAVLTTDALMCNITFTRVVMSATQKGQEVERQITLDVLIGPCPATDVFAILNQRVTLTHFRATLKATAAIKPELDDLDHLGRDLQQEILAISHDIEDLSLQANAAPILESLLKDKNVGNSQTNKPQDSSMVIFADKTNRMSVTYFSTKMQVRLLMARQAFLKAYFWHVLEFSKFAVSKTVGKTVLPNFDKEIDIDAIAILTKRARSTLKYGDPSRLGDGTDSDDSDEDEARVAKRAAKKQVSTTDLVKRVEGIMMQLAKDVRALFFQGYRRKFTPTYCEFLASKLVYEQYLVIVGYLATILLDDSTEAQIPTTQVQAVDKSMTSQMLHFTSVATSALTLGTVKLNTGPTSAEAPKVSASKKIDSQKKHELISFVLSQDSLFEQYLHANLFACEYKFSARPHLSMCLDFDVLIGKFADMLNDNIQMWNSKALKVFMCRKVEEGVAPSRLPWDITTMRDAATGNEMYISHIPESIQIQLNVQIGMKKINTTGMGDSLSLMSIKRIYEINLKIAKAIARAYLALAVEYENFLEDTISALSAEDLNAGNRVTNMIQHVGMKMIDVSTLGMLNVAGETPPMGQSARTQVSQEESDELLCFLMSIVNDCTRINKEHIPQSVLSFVKEFGDNGDAVLTSADGKSGAAQSSGVLTPGLTAAEEINGYFFNPIKAIKSVSRNAINCLTNQVFFHGDLREYFLRTFSDHMQVKPASGSGPLFSVKLPGVVPGLTGGAIPESPKENEEEEEEGGEEEQATPAPAPDENPIATIVATLQDMYGFTAEHVAVEDQHRIVHNCLKKLIMRYLIMLRDVLVQKNYSRMSVALNKGLDTGLKVGRTMLNITTLGLADHLQGDKGSNEHLSDLDRSSSHHANALTAESFSPAQITEIRQDLETIMEAHLEVPDDSVAELLQFFNKAVNSVIAGVSCDPRTLDRMLLDRFHMTPPVYSPDQAAYDRALELFIGLNASTHELTHSEMETRMNKSYTIQFQDFTCIKLKDYRVCVVRVTFAGITVQSSILSSNMVGSAQIKWKDILRFEHVKGYQNKEVLVELVEIRPMGMRREMILARVRIQLSELSQFITPEPYPASTNGKIVSSPTAGHSGWFVLEEVPAEIYSARGLTNMLRDVTVGTLSTTKAVTNTTVNATVSVLMSPMKLMEDGDEMGNNSNSNSSVGKSSHHTNPGAASSLNTPGTSVQNTPAKARNNYLSILSSDQPRDDVEGPQLKIRIRIVEEKE